MNGVHEWNRGDAPNPGTWNLEGFPTGFGGRGRRHQLAPTQERVAPSGTFSGTQTPDLYI